MPWCSTCHTTCHLNHTCYKIGSSGAFFKLDCARWEHQSSWNRLLLWVPLPNQPGNCSSPATVDAGVLAPEIDTLPDVLWSSPFSPSCSSTLCSSSCPFSCKNAHMRLDKDASLVNIEDTNHGKVNMNGVKSLVLHTGLFVTNASSIRQRTHFHLLLHDW